MIFIDYTPWGKLWIFIGFQYFIFSFMGIFAFVVEDVPEEVYIYIFIYLVFNLIIYNYILF